MAKQEVLSAPIALIKVGKKTIGKMRDARYQESYRRVPIIGIGNLNPSEAPAVAFSATLTCSYYTVDFANHPMTKDAILRAVNDGNIAGWANTVTLQEVGLTVQFLRKKASLRDASNKDGRNSQQIIEADPNDYEVFAILTNCFITGDGFDISESNVSGHNSTFDVLDPALYPTDRLIAE